MALLPYLEQQALYDRFHLDEPWDSPHNNALHQRDAGRLHLPRPGRCLAGDDDLPRLHGSGVLLRDRSAERLAGCHRRDFELEFCKVRLAPIGLPHDQTAALLVSPARSPRPASCAGSPATIARQASPMVVSRWSAHSFARPCRSWLMSRLYASMTRYMCRVWPWTITQLTVAQPELLLAVPMKGLRARPAMPVNPHDPTHLPGDPVGHQDLHGSRIVSIPPHDHDPDLVIHLRDAHRHGEVPLPLVADPHLLAVPRRDRGRQFVGLDDLPLPLQLAVALQVADVAPGPPESVLSCRGCG